MKKKDLNTFKKEVFEKYGDSYEVLGDYINNKTPILIKHNLCKKEFLVRPDIFISNYKKGCPYCFSNKKKTHEEFVKEVFNLFGNEYTVLGI